MYSTPCTVTFKAVVSVDLFSQIKVFYLRFDHKQIAVSILQCCDYNSFLNISSCEENQLKSSLNWRKMIECFNIVI